MSRLALTPTEAAQSLGVSRNFFDQQIKPHLKIVYVGARVMVPVTSIEDWLLEKGVRAA